MIAAALAVLDAPLPVVDADLAADFLALGYAHYVTETITVNIRYMNSLDEAGLERELLAAARAACSGEKDEAHARLQAAFDLMHTAREYYYPSESYLLDLTLVAVSTLGAALREQLAGAGPVGSARSNLLLSAEVLQQMAAKEPATLELLRQAMQQGTAGIVGGEFRELELPLLGPEAIRAQLEKGLAIYHEHLAARPAIFARRRFGMTPALPQILDHLGFRGVLHATLDDGRFPAGSPSRRRWEGIDGTGIEALLRVPIDAARGEGFLRLPHALCELGGVENQPTVILAHWPGKTSPWYEDSHRASRYTSVLGTRLTLPDYFERTGTSGHETAPKADEYRSPYLQQDVAAGRPNPISRWVQYYRRRANAEASQTLAALATLASGKSSVCVDKLLDDVDESLTGTADEVALAERLREANKTAAADFTRAIGGKPPGSTDVAPRGAALVLANPLSFSRRLRVDVTEFASLPDTAGAVLRAAEQGGRKSIVAEVPPLGFLCLFPGSGNAAEKPARARLGFFRKPPAPSLPMAEMVAESSARGPGSSRNPAKAGTTTAVLRNEFFELAIDPHTGAIRSVFDFHSRAPRLAQQLAFRLGGAADEEAAYSIMAADEIRVLAAGPVVGEVQVRGRLMDRAGQSLAAFEQRTRVMWGSRVIEVEIDLDPHRLPEGDPWNSYYAARFAWGHDAPMLYRGVNQAILATEAAQVESPQFVESRGEAGRTTILTAGLPYHRRRGLRKLDSLLIVRGERARQFRFGIGIDLGQPMAAALEFIAPAAEIAIQSRPNTDSAWLFHLESRTVVATHWEAVVEGGAVAGFRARLLETEGRQVSLGLRSFRAIHSAQKAGGADRPPIDLTVEGDRVTVPLRPYEWAEVEGRFG